MAKEKIISFIIPAYNSENYLKKCLNSFLMDPILECIEVIIVNDGSTDSTAQIGEEYHERYPDIFAVIHKENGGHGSAINVGVKKATGKYIKVVDSDDWVHTEVLREYVEQLSNAKADIIISPYYTVDMKSGQKEYFSIAAESCGNETDLESMIRNWGYVQNGFTFHGIAYLREFYLRGKHQLLEKVFYEDHEYATIPCCFAKTVLAVDLPLYAYQLGNTNQSVDMANQVKRSAHLKAVIHRMEKYYLKNQKSLSDAGKQYYFYKLKTVVNTYYKVVCLAEPDRKKGRRMAANEEHILKQKLPEFWKENHNKYLLFQVMNRLSVSSECYSKALNSGIYKKLKNNSQATDKYRIGYDGRKYMEGNKVKVSIVIPIYNVERYLRQCLDSVVNQTLKELEIICVNDGSTDSSPDIIAEYAAKDSRVKVITKPNSGYGHSMNMGFDLASGEYIGIVESDDYADPEMFETLYRIASQNKLDVVKSGYYFYYSIPKEKNEKQEIVSKVLSNKTFCPTTFFQSKMEMVEFFNIKPTIWSAIYRKDFIRENSIRFNETPGASFQDASFNFKVWSCAQRVQLLQDAFLHYRQDNESSSVNSKGKIFCVCDEYEEMQRFLNKHPEKKGTLEYIKNRIKYDTYMWNYERLADRYKYIFIERAAAEFKADMEDAKLDKEYFEWYKWNNLHELIKDPIAWHTKKMLDGGAKYVEETELNKVLNSTSYRIGRMITFIPRKIKGGIQCAKDHGVKYTIKLAVKKIFKK